MKKSDYCRFKKSIFEFFIMKRSIIILLFNLSIIVLFSSCEGYRAAKGIAKDKVTNLPLDSVLCNVKTGNMKVYTDPTGKFDVHNQMGGCAFGCKKIIVEFSKNGYKTIVLEDDAANGTILMEQ